MATPLPGQGAPTGTAAVPAPTQAAPAATPSLEDRWKAYFSDPSIRSAALQFAVSAMQPIAPGQSFAGHIGLSLGDAGQAAQRGEVLKLKQREATREEQATSANIEQGAEQNSIARDRNAIAREGNVLEGARNTRAEAKDAAQLKLDQQRLKLEERRAAAYEKAVSLSGARAGSKAKIDPVLARKLDLIDEMSLLEDDPLAYQAQEYARLGVGDGATAPASQPAPAAAPAAPAVGATEVFNGKSYRFKGGDASKPESWEEVK